MLKTVEPQDFKRIRFPDHCLEDRALSVMTIILDSISAKKYIYIVQSNVQLGVSLLEQLSLP